MWGPEFHFLEKSVILSETPADVYSARCLFGLSGREPKDLLF
jgi:hypothetical protein